MASKENTKEEEYIVRMLDLLKDLSMNSNFNGFYDSNRYDASYIDGIDATLNRVLIEVPVEYRNAYTKMFNKLRHASKREVTLFDEMNTVEMCMKYSQVSKVLPACGMRIMRIEDLNREIHTTYHPRSNRDLPNLYNVYGFVGVGGLASTVENLQQCIALSVVTGCNFSDICPFTIFGGTLAGVDMVEGPEFAFEYIDWETGEIRRSHLVGRWNGYVTSDRYVIVERKDQH